jgi:hypothetical protein
LIPLLLVLGTTPAHADGAVGIFFGLNNGSISGDTPAETSYQGRTGFLAGAFGEIRIASDVMLGLHPMYVQKGTNIAQKPPAQGQPPIENDLRLDYLSFPLLFKIETNGGVTYFSGGIDLAYLLDTRLKTDAEEVGIEDLLKKWDLSMAFAFGGTIRLGSPFLNLELRYTQSLLNLADIQIQGQSYQLPVRFRSSGFQLLAGLLFPLGGDSR